MSISSRFELPTDRLATADRDGKRLYLYPADVHGKYRIRRDGLGVILIAVFLILPWIRINGHPAVLLDIAHRKFALFGVGFWAHEAPLLVLVVGTLLFALAFATAVFGRVWCGWACPQTVFVDGVFRRIERWIEGDALARRKLDEAPWSADKATKKAAKWATFSAFSLVISHSLLAYFVGTEELSVMLRQSPAQNAGAFSFMLAVFALVLFDFGWFREQFCVVLCPYGRFQSVLMDPSSQTVAYDSIRGEPRRGLPLVAGQPAGDCVNCYRCVQVCPTGIDIRRGVQMECIACTACIDACDDVMERLKKPQGLIRYQRSSGFSVRGRLTLGALLSLLLALTLVLRHRSPVEFDLLRAAETPYQVIDDSRVVNHFKIDVMNQTFDDLRTSLEIPEELARLGVTRVVSNLDAVLPAGQAGRGDLFVQFPKTLLRLGKATVRVRFRVMTSSGRIAQERMEEVPLVGPYR